MRKALRGGGPKPSAKPRASRFLSKRWLYGAAAASAAGFLFGNSGFRSIIRNTVLLRSLEFESAALQSEEVELRSDIASARSKDRILQDAARKMGYLKPGEIEYRFPPPK